MRRSDACLAPVIEVVERRLGTSCAGPRASVIEDAIWTIMARHGARDPARYARRLEGDTAALTELAEVLRVPETFFLRESGQLDVLRERVLPALVSDPSRSGPLQLWSAGCASGEEAYSLAILLEAAGLADRARILATDRSAAALAAARRGVYGAWSLRSVGADDRERWFTPAGSAGKLRVDDRLRNAITFRGHDLVTDAYPAGVDVIVCRNVLLYLTAEHGAAVVERLATSLEPGGWLLLGSTDPHHHAAVLLEEVRTASGTLYRRPGGRGALPPAESDRQERPQRGARPDTAPTRSGASAPSPARIVSDRRAGSAPVPAGVAPAEREDDLNGELRRCELALAERPLHVDLHVRHATLLLESGQPVRARRAVTAALFLAPELAVGHLLLGRALLALNEPSGAKRAFHDARMLVATLPEDAPVAASPMPAGRLLEVADAAVRQIDARGSR